ncbi:unnamed protein product (macronuclear) [Paramecium tetraurelia]|uniref:Kinesin-like protein n=1 Tax=Paramecium tetraurelia TaxID=5888 RepID=A0BK26_PARTE|nr:uncharacterized protein GSPATT00029523001 [Paramecium tetraurelia]CAK58893.1 unnamed protein product [Paramecium tetraurelia]|eukprot:XP_001426291.1 hypothetical protein (macronuclear) [Paramecium tetraurelia strain d4-2]
MENIQVAVRIRPDPEPSIWAIHDQHIFLNNQMRKPPNGQGRTTFAFDHCFSQDSKNADIYSKEVKSLVLGSTNGINGTIFLYGQTGSGKTFTMLGKENDEGVLLQSFKDLFAKIEADLNKTYVLRCSYFEIYNEQIFDLLKPSSKLQETLQVNEDQKKEFYVKGLIEQSVSSINEIFEVLKRGEINRHYAQTAMNHNSSRSHAIFRLQVQSITNNFIRQYRREQSQHKFPTLEQLEAENNQLKGAMVTESVLNFVDLAGSEKVSNHFEDAEIQDTNRRVKEGQYINKSLFFLTQVIYLKAEDKGHVPFRNSSLTKILKSSLDGSSRTLIILCINAAALHFDYSISTLRFGMNAKKIETKVLANINYQNDDEALKILLSDYEKKLHDFEKIRVEEKEGFEQQLNQLQIENQSLQNRISTQNAENFKCIPKLYKEPTWADRFKHDFHCDGAGDILVTNTKVKKPPQHDCQGKLVLNALKASEQNRKTLLSNYEVVKKQYLQLNEYYNQSTLRLQQQNEQIQCLNLQYNKLYSYASEMKQQLNFDVKQLENQELEQMISFYQSQLLKLQIEQQARGQSMDQKKQYDVEQFRLVDQKEDVVDVQQYQQIDLDEIMQSNMVNVEMVKEKEEDHQNQSVESEEFFKIEFPTYLHHSNNFTKQTMNETASQLTVQDLSEINFKNVLQSFISEMDVLQPSVSTHHKNNSTSCNKKQTAKYKTPDKLKKQSTSQTTIRGKQNIEPTRQSFNNIPKPKVRPRQNGNANEELSMLLNNTEMSKN